MTLNQYNILSALIYINIVRNIKIYYMSPKKFKYHISYYVVIVECINYARAEWYMIIDEFTNDIDFSCLTREQQMDSVAWSLRLKPERSDPILTNQNDLFLNCKVNQYWLSCNILLQKLTNRNLFDGINWYYHAFGFIYLHSVNYKKYSSIRYFFRCL